VHVSNDGNHQKKKLYWWNDPVGQDDKFDAGRDMMKTLLIWATIVVALVLVLIVVRAT